MPASVTDYDWRSVVSQPGQIQPYLRDVLSGDIGVRAAEKMAAGQAPISEFEYFGQPGNDIPGGVEPDPNFNTTNFIESAYKNEVSQGGADGYAPIWADVFRTLPGLALDTVLNGAPTELPDVDVPTPPSVNPFPFVLDVSVSGSGVVGEPVFATVTHQVPGSGAFVEDDVTLPIMLQSFSSGSAYRTTIIEDVSGPQSQVAVTPESAGEITVGAVGTVLGSGNKLDCTAVRYLNNEFGNGVLSSYARDGAITFGSIQRGLTDLQSGAISLTQFGILAEAVDRCPPSGSASPPSEPMATSAPVQIAPEGEPAPSPTPDESELSVELTNLEPVGFSDARATFEVRNNITSGAGEQLSTTVRILVDGQVADATTVTVPAGESRQRERLLTDLAETEREVEVCVELA